MEHYNAKEPRKETGNKQTSDAQDHEPWLRAEVLAGEVQELEERQVYPRKAKELGCVVNHGEEEGKTMIGRKGGQPGPGAHESNVFKVQG